MAQNHQKYVFSTIFLSYDFSALLFLKWQVGQSKKSDENFVNLQVAENMTNLQENNDKIHPKLKYKFIQ